MRKLLMIWAVSGLLTAGLGVNVVQGQHPEKSKKVKANGTVKEKKVKDNGTVKEKKTKPDGSVKKETKKYGD